MNYKHNPKLTSNAQALRKDMTKEEKHLWYDFLKHYSLKFLRQKVIDNYIVDFYCPTVKLVIEIDGKQHYTQDGKEKDEIRTEKLNERRLTVIRVPNYMVNNDFIKVCSYIDRTVKRLADEAESLHHR